MQTPLISIALCTYNGENYLIEQLDSLVNQDYPNLEIIVTDDRSSDQTVSIIQDYITKFPFVKLYQNAENLGYIKNFEKAIQLCSGDFIALSDQDDIWALDKISKMVDHIGDNLLIYHDSEFINDDGETMNKRMSDIIHMYAGNDFRPFLFFNSVSGHACLFKKELVEQGSLPFPKGVFHDRWLAYTATNMGSIAYLNLPLVKYRQHDNSDTNILKLERKNISTAVTGNRKIQNTIVELETLLKFKHNKDPDFVAQLLQLYRQRLTSYICFSLVILMYKNFSALLYTSNKSTLSKLNFVFKHLWGGKLKKTD
ncbi:glycosyltransferase family 2 protein [Pedobacter nyackensis]|uniref:Glycosyltransferase involved in cell wall bisynthesis n=1 Tax=Pedobacter nyackensis TaxID=475255 RepID=A0A1W2BIT5_9SPHI|nr:glycosyltransferase family 2 protein [Pedobacter nyackensis]SMC72781.1 Glycosyltransferase involved in cell wall bisynthesis [Pedobacter nyackensis]